ncbi:hypothetical protein SS05631_a46500 (plasmid) [Sinorhizobium sp. CCBAU 05631]|nr:hypothetical protein SS05631_a46500 [Sinorhizobium sp. CCBAU 05631]
MRLLSYFADINGSEDMKRRYRKINYDAFYCLVKASPVVYHRAFLVIPGAIPHKCDPRGIINFT